MVSQNAADMIISMAVLTFVSAVFMGLRFWCKRMINTKLGLDDAVLFLGFTLHFIFEVISIYMLKLGLGRHMVEIDMMTELPKLLYWLPIAQWFAIVSIAVSKSSFAITLLRLVTATWQKAALWFLLLTINGAMGSISIVQFFQCSVPPKPGCVNNDAVVALAVFAAGYSAFADLALTSFPFLIIRNLQMKRREKAGIIVSMSCGVVAGIVGIYKASTIPTVSRSLDFTYTTTTVLIWVVAEVSATVIACSIPFLRPLVRHIKTSKNSNNSYGLSGMSSRGTHNKLGSRADAKAGGETDDGDRDSDRDVQPLKPGVVRRTDVFTVEYDNWSAHDGAFHNGVQGASGTTGPQVSRREMC
ncbi:hypothetical protein VTJ83DRAFT_2721 [Remersonia thermophila]|uniref:Rhodopsin domain-containing protein n=1 Tax=Remersonia thermophila TaxID=72144 RepID=A0ABR4DJQ7_9PEZI